MIVQRCKDWSLWVSVNFSNSFCIMPKAINWANINIRTANNVNFKPISTVIIFIPNNVTFIPSGVNFILFLVNWTFFIPSPVTQTACGAMSDGLSIAARDSNVMDLRRSLSKGNWALTGQLLKSFTNGSLGITRDVFMGLDVPDFTIPSNRILTCSVIGDGKSKALKKHAIAAELVLTKDYGLSDSLLTNIKYCTS